MCCVMGYTGHDLSAAKFKEYLLRTVMHSQKSKPSASDQNRKHYPERG